VTTTALARIAAVAAAAAVLGLGVPSSLRTVPPEQRRPVWAATLAPLAAAPIPSGRAVVLVTPAGLDAETSRPLLYEACWQRPDLLLAMAPPPPGMRVELVVTLPGAPAPAGFSAIWRRDGLVLWRRASP
jgi:hypothetical protein